MENIGSVNKNIVILIILATVTINLALGEGGLIDRAQDAKDLTEQATRDEQEQLDSVLGEIDSILEENQETVENTNIYATLYDDGTLGFSSTQETISGKTVIETWDITNQEYMIGDESKRTPWYEYDHTKVETVIFVDEVVPTNVGSWFAQCVNLKNLDLTNLNTTNVTDMSYMFYGCNSLSNITFGEKFNTEKVTDMRYMFAGNLTMVSLDLSNFDTSNVTNMTGMFYSCHDLSNIVFGERFNTEKVTDMTYMFADIYSMESLDLSDFNTQNVTSMIGMFRQNNMQSVDITSFDTSNVTNMAGMFYGCMYLGGLEFGNNFKTNNVTNMVNMFTGCLSLTILDLTTFDTSEVTSMAEMFYGCTSLEEIQVNGETWHRAPTDTEMFGGECGVSDVKPI